MFPSCNLISHTQQSPFNVVWSLEKLDEKVIKSKSKGFILLLVTHRMLNMRKIEHYVDEMRVKGGLRNDSSHSLPVREVV